MKVLFLRREMTSFECSKECSCDIRVIPRSVRKVHAAQTKPSQSTYIPLLLSRRSAHGDAKTQLETSGSRLLQWRQYRNVPERFGYKHGQNPKDGKRRAYKI